MVKATMTFTLDIRICQALHEKSKNNEIPMSRLVEDALVEEYGFRRGGFL